jgi:hypothetical protein
MMLIQEPQLQTTTSHRYPCSLVMSLTFSKYYATLMHGFVRLTKGKRHLQASIVRGAAEFERESELTSGFEAKFSRNSITTLQMKGVSTCQVA